MNFSAQLVLGIRSREEVSFSNFIVGENQQLLLHLKEFLKNPQESFFYIAGAKGSGKSHLLQACCHAVSEQGTAIYIPLSKFSEFDVRLLENLEHNDLVCIDDIQAIAGDMTWQEAILHLYNRAKASQAKLIISGNLPVRELGITLADLASRLSWGVSYQLLMLNDENKLVLLQQRAKERGFDLSEEVAMYLLNRYSRDITVLSSMLDRLDIASLAEQRKLTIPFVKKVLNL